jgi:hypothetical protein
MPCTGLDELPVRRVRSRFHRRTNERPDPLPVRQFMAVKAVAGANVM